MKCYECGKKMSLKDKLRVFRFKLMRNKDNSKYLSKLKKGLCSDCSFKTFINWTEDFKDRIGKSNKK